MFHYVAMLVCGTKTLAFWEPERMIVRNLWWQKPGLYGKERLLIGKVSTWNWIGFYKILNHCMIYSNLSWMSNYPSFQEVTLPDLARNVTNSSIHNNKSLDLLYKLKFIMKAKLMVLRLFLCLCYDWTVNAAMLKSP